ncbi:MAG: DNA polymerase I [Oscillospiraceae bacterium]|nr:DNA polymerase I [Oscillospiraceae bacterium]
MKVMILDGNSIFNRAFYGIRALTAPDGLYTNAVYGFISILRKLIADDAPDALCVAFDLKAPTFRHRMYPGYKADRKGMPDEMAQQLPWLKDVLDAMNIPRYELEGYEADDIIGTVSAKCEASGDLCLIVTGDRDSLQLIGPMTRVKLVSTRQGRSETVEYDEAAFVEKYGFPPRNLVDCKALMGDSSDSIPGVAGIGEKTAGELIRRFVTLDAVYDNINDPSVKASVRAKLEQGRESARLSYALAEIDRAAPFDFSPSDALMTPPDNDRLYGLFARLGFNKLIDAYSLSPPAASPSVSAPKLDWISASPEDALAACRACETVFFCCDDSFSAFALIADRPYLVIGPDSGFIKEFFAPGIRKAGSGVKDLMRLLCREGTVFGDFVFDAALAAYVLDPSETGYDLVRCARRLLNRDIRPPVYNQDGAFGLLDSSEAIEALEEHAVCVRDIFLFAAPLIDEQGMHALYYDIELPLCRVLADMEYRGFLVDRRALTQFGIRLGEVIDELRSEIYELAGGEFNINSPKQLGELLFEKLMLPPYGKTKSGYSTNIDVLNRLVGKHPIVSKIIDYRKFTKLKSTYTDGLARVIDPDGRIRTHFNMTATATGRLSSTEPNLQNIPVRTELGGEMRRMFVAPEGSLLVDADYSQIELRILAHISGDEAMRAAFISGEDIHAVTASRVFGVPLDRVSGAMRSRAKAVNFGIVYGISDYSLSQDIGVTRAEARDYIDSYLEKYSGVRAYLSAAVEQAREKGYASTVFGRRRYLPDLKDSNFNRRSFAERVAMNMPIQGAAADIIKIAMVRIHKRFAAEGMLSRLILQVHDELIAECPEAEAEKAASILAEEMENAVSFSVPLTVDAHIGRSWYDAK